MKIHLRLVALLLSFSISSFGQNANSKPLVRVFEGAKIQEIYRVVLDRDALLLESIEGVIRDKRIQDGHVTVTAGSVQECTYHYVKSAGKKPTDVFQTVKGPFEILNAGGIIADGKPHIHITIKEAGQTAIGGHLENGCKILYLGEVTIFKYAGPSLTRRANENGITLLDKK
ncbi:MAG: DNA-binding protein [Candidatus Solibacter usitatus]|nr:DNA-binding protein [Candidatus Solibacter usitatus]